ncbi:MAG: hypothetical protein RLZZ284_672 [Actinomycetota bacterium]
MSARARIGVLALQGAFAAHALVLERLGATVHEVRVPSDLDDCDALVMPGGESTTMSKLLESSAYSPCREHLGLTNSPCSSAAYPHFRYVPLRSSTMSMPW